MERGACLLRVLSVFIHRHLSLRRPSQGRHNTFAFGLYFWGRKKCLVVETLSLWPMGTVAVDGGVARGGRQDGVVGEQPMRVGPRDLMKYDDLAVIIDSWRCSQRRKEFVKWKNGRWVLLIVSSDAASCWSLRTCSGSGLLCSFHATGF